MNEGNIIVRSPTGATMISAQGINVNEFTENVMRGFNMVRNPFWIDRRREYKTRWIQTYSDNNHRSSGSPASRAMHQIISATVDGKEYIYVFILGTQVLHINLLYVDTILQLLLGRR